MKFGKQLRIFLDIQFQIREGFATTQQEKFLNIAQRNISKSSLVRESILHEKTARCTGL